MKLYSYCYKWEPAAYFSNSTVPNPTLTTIPGSSIPFTVTVIDDDGNITTNVVNVFVYELKMEIFHPKVFNNGVNVPAGSAGAQTFINIDNDDNDSAFDIDDNIVEGGDNELAKIKFSINILGADFPTFAGESTGNKSPISALKLDRINVALRPILGQNTVKMWNFEQKESLFDNVLSLKNGDFKTEIIQNVKWKTAEVWVEGITAHQQQQGAVFEAGIINIKDDDGKESGEDISNKEGCNKAFVALTVAEIASIEWIGMGNGDGGADQTKKDIYESDILADYSLTFKDADNPTNTWSSTSVRVFPDGRYSNTSVPKSKVKIKITISPPLPNKFTLHIKSFDMDDPSQNADNKGTLNQPPGGLNEGRYVIDPNDDPATKLAKDYFGTINVKYNLENDNRATDKTGYVTPNTGNIITSMEKTGTFNGVFSVDFAVNQSVRDDIEFTVSQFAGDNYALYGYCDKTFLPQLKNTDSKHGDKIIDDFTLTECPLKKKFQSKILTIWRLLHVEVDKMKMEDKVNEAQVYFTDFEMATNSTKNIEKLIGMPNLRTVQNCTCGGSNNDDNSPNLIPQTIGNTPNVIGNGRFEKGVNTKMTIGVSENYQNMLNSVVVKNIQGNGNDFIKSELGTAIDLKDLKCVLKKGALILECKLVDVSKASDFNWNLVKLNNSLSFSQFTDGEISFGNSIEKFSIVSITDNGSNGLVKTNAFKIYAILTDDDMKEADGANNFVDYKKHMQDAFEQVFIQPVIDGGGLISNNQSDLPITTNIPDPIKVQCLQYYYDTYHQSKNLATDNYWVVYVARLWQASFRQDYDDNMEAADNGYTAYPLGATTSISNLVPGLDISYSFRETLRDYMKNSPKASTFLFGEEGTIVHEIGHQFGLSHGDGSILGGGDPDDLNLGLDDKNDMGIMGNSVDKVNKNARTSKDFMPIHITLMRSRVFSPGQ